MTTMTITDLELTQLFPSPLNPREDVGDEQAISEMADSLREKGLLQPLLVVPHPSREGDYEVLIGHRRLAAARRLGWSSLSCEVVTDRFTGDADKIAVMLTENLHRADLTAVEEGQAMQAMLDLPGYSLEKVAKATSKSVSTVRRRTQLLSAGEQVLAAVKEKKIDLFQAEEIAKYSDEPDLAKDLTTAAESGDDWRWKQATSRASSTLNWRQSVDKLHAHLTGLGYELIDAEQTRSPEYTFLPPFYYSELPTKPQEVLELSNYVIPQKVLDEYGKDCLRAYLSHGAQRVQWYAFIEQEEEAAEPELTAEEIAEQEAREKVELALRVEHPKFKEHLEELIHKPAKLKGTAHAALIAAICDRNYTLKSVLEIFGIDHDPEDKDLREKGRAKLAEKTIDQLAYVLFLYEVINFNSSGTSNLYRLNEHDPARNGNWAARKFELLESVYGIEPGEAIRQAWAFWEPSLPGTEAEAVSDEVNF
ncbi:ParB/RepB/Spo0J family partition protein [Rothia sp. CCM 9416]|uniref:ParB/RepB/Spo0J family partition protein n=1 Tax=Rothia sp. CCM 9416 TaxID=3402655 RepID=UPI003AE0DB45